jgi:hypothetical protein
MTKFLRIYAVMLMLLIPAYSSAGEIDSAAQILDQFLKNKGRGAVSKRASCPNNSSDIEYFVDYTHKPVDDNSSIVNAFTMLCPEGNSVNQYLILLQGSGGRVIAGDLIGDMNFKGDDIRIDGDTIIIEGVKWSPNDAHCCPSKEGTLEYNIKTGKHKYKLHKLRN